MKMELKLLSVVALHLLFHVSLALSELPLARGSNGQDLIEVLSQPAAWACVDSATVSWRCLSDSTAACSFSYALLNNEHDESTAATWVSVESFGAGNATATVKFPRPGDTLAGGAYWLLLRADLRTANAPSNESTVTATTRVDFGVACGAPTTTIEASPALLSRTSSGTFLFNGQIAAPLEPIRSSNSSRNIGSNSGLPISHFAVAYDRPLGSRLTAKFAEGATEASSGSSAGSAWPTFSGTATLALPTEPTLDSNRDTCVFNFTTEMALKSSATSTVAPASSSGSNNAALLSLSDLSYLEVVMRPAAAEGTEWVTAGSAPLSPTLTWETSTATSGSGSSDEVGYASAASADGVGGFFEVPRSLLAPPGPNSGSSHGNCSTLALLAYLASPGRLRLRLSASGAGDLAPETKTKNVSSAAARLADHGRTTRPWETFNLGEGSSGAHSFAVAAVDQSGNVNGKNVPPEAMYAWTVDLTSVRTVLDSRPASTTESTSALFRFSCIDPAAPASTTGTAGSRSSTSSSSTHACSYDYVVLSGDQSGASTFTAGVKSASKSSASHGVGWTASGQLSLENLAEGAHTFRLRACRYPPNIASDNSTMSAHVDDEGDAKAAARECDPDFLEWAWVVDTAKPETRIVSGPPLMSSSTSATFELESSRPFTSHSSAGQTTTPFLCRHTKPYSTEGQTGSSGSDISGSGNRSSSDSSDSSINDLSARLSESRWTTCWSATKLSGLAPGLHTLEARAVDAVGQVDQTPSEWTWLVHPFKVEKPIEGCPVLPLDTAAGRRLKHVNVTVVLIDSAEDRDAGTAVGWAVTATSSSSSSASSGPAPMMVAEGTTAGIVNAYTVPELQTQRLTASVPLPFPLGANVTINYTLEVWPAAPALEVLRAWAITNEMAATSDPISSNINNNGTSAVATPTVGNSTAATSAAMDQAAMIAYRAAFGVQCHYQVDKAAVVVRVNSASLPPAVTSAEHIKLRLNKACGTAAMGCEYALIYDDIKNDDEVPVTWTETGPSLDLSNLAEGAWTLHLRPCRAPAGLGPCGNAILDSNKNGTPSGIADNGDIEAMVYAVRNVVRWIVDRRLPKVSFVHLPLGVSLVNDTAVVDSTTSSTSDTPPKLPTFRRLVSTAATEDDDDTSDGTSASSLNAAIDAGNVVINSDTLNVEVVADKPGCRFFYWLTQTAVTSPSSAKLSPVVSPNFSLEHVDGGIPTTGKGTNGWVEWTRGKENSGSSSRSSITGSTTAILEIDAAPAGIVEQRILWIVAADSRGMAPLRPLNAVSWIVDHRYPRTFLVAAPPHVAATADAAFYLDCALDASPNPLRTEAAASTTVTSTTSTSESSVERVFMERAGGGPLVSSVSETAPASLMIAGDGAQCAFQYALDQSEDWINAENPMVLFQVPKGAHTLRIRASRVLATDTDADIDDDGDNSGESDDSDDDNDDEHNDDDDASAATETPEAVWDPNPISFIWTVDLLPPKIELLSKPQSPLHEPLAAFSFLGNKPLGALELFVHLSYDPNPANVAIVGGGSGGGNGGHSSNTGSTGVGTGTAGDDSTASDDLSESADTSGSSSGGDSSATSACGDTAYSAHSWWRACSSDYATVFRDAADLSGSSSSTSLFTNETFGTWVKLDLSDLGSNGLLEDATTTTADATTASNPVSLMSSRLATLSVALHRLEDGAYRARFGALDRRSGAIDKSLLSGMPLEFAWAVDSSKPETFVLSAPRSPSAVADASFLVDSSFPSATFDFCTDANFDDFDWGALSSRSSSSEISGAGCAYNVSAETVSVHELSGGGHNITMRARHTTSGVDGAPASMGWLVDLDAPNTFLLAATPPGLLEQGNSFATHLASVGLVVKASEPVTRFVLRARDPGGSVVNSPAAFSGASSGVYDGVSLEVSGVASGSACLVESPCFVDVPNPSPMFSSSSTSSVSTARATYYFASSTTAYTLESLTVGLENQSPDLGAVDVMAVYLDFLSAGPHVFELQAVDRAGNVDASPASVAFVVDPALRPGPPAAPRLLTANGYNNGAKFMWETSPDDGMGTNLPTLASVQTSAKPCCSDGGLGNVAPAVSSYHVAARSSVRGKSVFTYRTLSAGNDGDNSGDVALTTKSNPHQGSTWLSTPLEPLQNQNLYEFVVTSRNQYGSSGPSWPSDPRVPWDPSDPCSSLDCNDAPDANSPGGACFLKRNTMGVLRGFCVCRPGFAGVSCRDRLDQSESTYYSATVAAVGATPGEGYSSEVAGSSSGSPGGSASSSGSWSGSSASSHGSWQPAVSGVAMASWWATPFGGCSRTCGGPQELRSTRLRDVRCGRYRDGALEGFFPEGEFSDEAQSRRRLVVQAEGGQFYYNHDSSWDESETCPLPREAMPVEEEECALLACGEDFLYVQLELDATVRFDDAAFSLAAQTAFEQSLGLELAVALNLRAERVVDTVAFALGDNASYAQLRFKDKGYEPDPWSNLATFTYPQAPDARSWEHPPGAGRGPPASASDDADDDGTGVSATSSSHSPPKGGVAVAFKILGPKAAGDSSLQSVAGQLAYAVNAPGSNLRTNGRHLRHVAPSTLRIAGGGLLEPATILSRWVRANTLIIVAQVLAGCGTAFLFLSVVGYRLAVARKKKRRKKRVDHVEGNEVIEDLPIAKGTVVATPFHDGKSGDKSSDPAETLAAAAWASAMGWLEGQIMSPLQQLGEQSGGSHNCGTGLDKKVSVEGQCGPDPVAALECKLYGANNNTTASSQSSIASFSFSRRSHEDTTQAEWNYGGDWRPSSVGAEGASTNHASTSDSSSSSSQSSDDDAERSNVRGMRSRRGEDRAVARERLLAQHAGESGGSQGWWWMWLPSFKSLGLVSPSAELPTTITSGSTRNSTNSSTTTSRSDGVTAVAPEAVSVVQAMPSSGLRKSTSCPNMTSTVVNMDELNALADQLAPTSSTSPSPRDHATRIPPADSLAHPSSPESPAKPSPAAPRTLRPFMSRKGRVQRRSARGASREVELAEMGCVESSTRSPFHEDATHPTGTTISKDGDNVPTTAASATAADSCAVSLDGIVVAGAISPFHADGYAGNRGLVNPGNAPEARI